GGEPTVLAGGLVPDLPRAVHLVAQAPEPDVVRFLGAVAAAQVGVVGAAGHVAVLQQVQCLLHPAGTEVDGHHRLRAGLAAPGDELVHADLVRLRGVPGQVRPPGPVLLWAGAVLPSVAGDEVAARVADGGDT